MSEPAERGRGERAERGACGDVACPGWVFDWTWHDYLRCDECALYPDDKTAKRAYFAWNAQRTEFLKRYSSTYRLFQDDRRRTVFGWVADRHGLGALCYVPFSSGWAVPHGL